MTYDEFVGAVQNRARLGSQGETVRAIHATLETLADRISKGEASDIAAQLPQEIGTYLTQSDKTEVFPLSDFFERVAKREGADLPDAAFHARAVISVLKEALTPGEWDDLRAQMPNEYQEMMDSGHTGTMET